MSEREDKRGDEVPESESRQDAEAGISEHVDLECYYDMGGRLLKWTWDHLYDLQTDNLNTSISGSRGDNSLYGGFFLGCLVDAFEVTGDVELKEKARKIFEGLWLNATVNGIPGYIVRGTFPDRMYVSNQPSVDQYTGLLYGCWRYYNSPFIEAPERERIGVIYEEVLARLESSKRSKWRITVEDGSSDTKFGWIDLWRPGWTVLSFLRAGYAVTGNQHWLDLYGEERRLRMPCNADWISTKAWMHESWVAIQTALGLHALIALEEEPEILAAYREALVRLAGNCQLQIAHFSEVPSAAAAEETLEPYYPGGRRFTAKMRNPVEGLTVMLLAGESRFIPAAVQALNDMNERLVLERADYAPLVVPWQWNQWLLLRLLKEQ